MDKKLKSSAGAAKKSGEQKEKKVVVKTGISAESSIGGGKLTPGGGGTLPRFATARGQSHLRSHNWALVTCNCSDDIKSKSIVLTVTHGHKFQNRRKL